MKLLIFATFLAVTLATQLPPLPMSVNLYGACHNWCAHESCYVECGLLRAWSLEKFILNGAGCKWRCNSNMEKCRLVEDKDLSDHPNNGGYCPKQRYDCEWREISGFWSWDCNGDRADELALAESDIEAEHAEFMQGDNFECAWEEGSKKVKCSGDDSFLETKGCVWWYDPATDAWDCLPGGFMESNTTSPSTVCIFNSNKGLDCK